MSPSENAQAPVSMLGEMLRALGVFVSNEQLSSAAAEVVEEDIRRRRLLFYLQTVKRAVSEHRLPPPFDQREQLNGTLDLARSPELRPFYGPAPDAASLRLQEPYWDDDAERNEAYDQSLWEVVGARETTLSLPDFIRLLVNVRPVARPRLPVLQDAFAALGGRGALVDRQTFVQLLEKLGEPIPTGELYSMLAQLTERGYGGQSLPDHLGAEEFARKYLDAGLDGADDPGDPEDFEDSGEPENSEGDGRADGDAPDWGVSGPAGSAPGPASPAGGVAGE